MASAALLQTPQFSGFLSYHAQKQFLTTVESLIICYYVCSGVGCPWPWIHTDSAAEGQEGGTGYWIEIYYSDTE